MTLPKSGLGLIVLARAEQLSKYSVTSDVNYDTPVVFVQAAVAILHKSAKEWPDNSIPIIVFNKIMGKDGPTQLAHAAAFIAARIDQFQVSFDKCICECDDDTINTVTIPAIENEIKSIYAYVQWAKCGGSIDVGGEVAPI